ncbi:MAG: hypothetical protein E7605_02465 [Ruminococcaceae bacterium]|nr:hypothetical protein [Oscillospiraceae bacterium]
MSWNDFYKSIQEAYHIEDESTVIKVLLDDVYEITTEALFYKRGYLDKKRIDLSECARNFDLAQGISPGQREGSLTCVGGRCFPFFEFFTAENHTRFYIPLKETAFTRFLKGLRLDPYRKERSKFHAFQKKLNDLGFTTLDLT